MASSSRIIDAMMLHARCISLMNVDGFFFHISVAVNLSRTIVLLSRIGNVFMTLDTKAMSRSLIGSVSPNPPLPLGRNVLRLMARSG